MENSQKLNPEQIIAEYEMLQSQSKAYDQNLQMIKGSFTELQSALETLRELDKLEENREALIPLGAGTFIEAVIAKPEGAILSIGADVSVKKPIEEVLEDLEGRIQDLERVRKEHSARYEEILQRLQTITPVVEQIMDAFQQKQTGQRNIGESLVQQNKK